MCIVKVSECWLSVVYRCVMCNPVPYALREDLVAPKEDMYMVRTVLACVYVRCGRRSDMN